MQAKRIRAVFENFNTALWNGVLSSVCVCVCVCVCANARACVCKTQTEIERETERERRKEIGPHLGGGLGFSVGIMHTW